MGPKVILSRNDVEAKNLRFFSRGVYPEPFDMSDFVETLDEIGAQDRRAEGLLQNDRSAPAG